MTRFLFIGTAEGKHNFITQDRYCNILVHYEYADRNDTSGASGKYKRWQYYDFDEPKVMVVRTDHPQHKIWNAKWVFAQQLGEKHRSVEYHERPQYNSETRKATTGLTNEQRAKLAEMNARDKALVELAPILADHNKVVFTRYERAVLERNKKYIPESERAWVEYVLSAAWKKKDNTPVCPF